MYERFYGLSEKPFRLTPDEGYFFPSRQHRRALAYLELGLHEGEGFLVITGEPGTGKTTLVKKLVSEHACDALSIARLETTSVRGESLLELLGIQFGFDVSGARTKGALIAALDEGFRHRERQGLRCVMIVDEAQNLADDAIEELRMLSNLTGERGPLLQTILVGQPALRERIESASLEQLRQRVSASFHLEPLSIADMKAYIDHRLSHARWTGDPEFQEGAHEVIHEFTGGTPRLVNGLCDRLLLGAFLDERHVISADFVRRVAAEAGIRTAPSRSTAHAGDPSSAAAEAATESGVLDAAYLQERLDALEARMGRMERRIRLDILKLRERLLQERSDDETPPKA